MAVSILASLHRRQVVDELIGASSCLGLLLSHEVSEIEHLHTLIAHTEHLLHHMEGVVLSNVHVDVIRVIEIHIGSSTEVLLNPLYLWLIHTSSI